MENATGLEEFLKGWGSLMVAVAALVLPGVIALYKRFFRQGGVDTYETGLLELSYGAWGPCIGLRGTLRAVHRDQFVRNIELTLVKEKDGSTHLFDWLLFRAEKITGLGTEDVSAEIASGFMLLTTQPHRYSVLFSDTATQAEMKPHVEALQDAWNRYKGTSAALAAAVAHQDLYESFSKNNKISTDAFVALDRLMYWQPGRYSLEMRVHTTRPERTFTRNWTFEITKAEAERLALNAVILCRLACEQPSTYVYANPKYQPPLPTVR